MNHGPVLKTYPLRKRSASRLLQIKRPLELEFQLEFTYNWLIQRRYVLAK